MKNRYIHVCYLIVLCIYFQLVPLSTLLADETPVRFKRLSVDDGLSYNTVLALTQDHNNKIWVGTTEGLNWHDGFRFASFYKSLGDTASLGNNYIYSLYTDRKGTVWAGTMVGLSRYNIIGNDFTNYSLPGNQSVQVFAMEEPAGREQLLLGTNWGLVLFEKTDGKMKMLPQLEGKNVYSVRAIGDGALLGTSKGIYFYYFRNGNIVQLLPELKNEVISSIIYDDKTRNCWLASLTNGVYLIDDKFQVREHYNRKNYPKQFVSDAVRALQLDDRGRLWIGTVEGLLILQPDTKSISQYRFSYEDPSSLGHNSVRSLLRDHQGGMLVGTYHGGLNYYHVLAPDFRVLQHSVYRNSLSDNTVSCIAEDPFDNNLWIGTNDGGLNHYDRTTGHFTCYSDEGNKAGSLRSNNIKCVFPEKNGSVYIGMHNGGLSHLNVKSGHISNYDIPGAASLENSCYSLLDGDDGTLWIGSMAGLYRFDYQTRQISLHPLAVRYPQLKDVLVSTLFRDSRRRVWIGTEESLYMCADGEMRVMADSAGAYSLGLIQALCVYEDSSHTIWVGTSSGLYRYKEGTSLSWERYSMSDGLPDDCISGILEDKKGRLWLTTSRGLSCFDLHKKNFCNYVKQDGLPNNQFMQSAVCSSKDGTFFLGTLNGVVFFNPEHFSNTPFTPNAVITGLSIQNHPIRQAKDGDIDFYQADNGKLLGVSFPSELKMFRITFSVINYLSNSRNKFAYKLEGYDSDWIYATWAGSRGVNYWNLSPGRYVFKVKACSDSGQWSETPAEFFIDIIPMWYQTWWAKTLFFLFIIGILVFVFYFFIVRAKMRMQVQIEHIERNKIEEISQEKVRFYINMSHELRTPLSLILAPLEELLGEKNSFEPAVQQKLSYVYKNGQKLLHIVNQLLDFRKAESGTLPIHIVSGPVESMAMNIFNLFIENARKRNINFHFRSDLKDELFPVDRMYLETILMNLLSNAFKFTPDGGEISLSLWKKEAVYGFTIRDNGIGIPEEKLSRIFERFYQVDDSQKGSGIGLSLVKLLIDKHRGTIEVASEIGKSTEFRVILPADIHVFPAEEQKQDTKASFTLSEPMYSPMDVSYMEEVAVDSTDMEKPDGMEEEGRATILLVDDNKEMVDYLKDNFKSDYITLIAGNGEEALEMMKEQKVDLILSDVMMPGIDGIKLCEIVKKNMQTCHIPVILLSAKGSLEAQTAGIQAGADDYIPKPFSMYLLKGKINNILKARQRLRYYYSSTIDIDAAKMTSNKLDEEFITKAIQTVEENISDEDFTADDLAEKLFMSRSSLYYKMNSISGEPPANFIRRIRFNMACKLLLDGRYSISEVSAMVGFASRSYFSTSFKKYMGCMPSDYVKKQRK